MRKWHALSLLPVVVGLYILREGSLWKYSRGPLDAAMFVAAMALLVWLLWPSSREKGE
jgi:hypothetical protein